MKLTRGAVRAVCLTYELDTPEVNSTSEGFTAKVVGSHGHTMRQRLVGVCRTLGRISGDLYVYADGDSDGTHTYIHFKKV